MTVIQMNLGIKLSICINIYSAMTLKSQMVGRKGL